MSLKSLLASKRAETKLQHPFAKYDTRNNLSCSLCAAPIKNVNLFSAHLLTGAHRTNLRKSEEVTRAKRAREEEEELERNIKTKEDETVELPGDFFTASNDAPSSASTPAPLSSVPLDVDEPAEEPIEEADEWAAFEASLAAQPSSIPSVTTSATATVFAAPVDYEFGAPKVLGEGEEEVAEEEEFESEEDRLERVAEETAAAEGEEIMERILLEESAQLEADSKVTALKQRLERIRQARKKN